MEQSETPRGARSLLLDLLEGLTEEEFKRFKFHLPECPLGAGESHIPRMHLEKASPTELSERMIAHYGDQRALEIAADLLPRIPKLDLLDTFQAACQTYLGEKSLLSEAAILGFLLPSALHKTEFVASATEPWKDFTLTLDGSDRCLSAMEWKALAYCLNNAPRIKGMDFKAYPLSLEEFRAIMPAMGKTSTLRLERCSLTGSCCAALSSVLSSSPALTELNLGGNELRDSDVRELCEGLRHPGCRLQTLGLWGCSLSAYCCADLSSVLSASPALTALDLNWNGLSDSGVRNLCEGLRHPGCRLQTLGLYSNDLTDECTADLCSALSTNRSLRQLKLGDNRFTRRSKAAFDSLRASRRPTLELIVDYS